MHPEGGHNPQGGTATGKSDEMNQSAGENFLKWMHPEDGQNIKFQEYQAIEQQEKGKEMVTWIISKSTESIEGMKDKLKWTISQLSRERGIWKINSDGKIYEFYSSAHHDMWDGVVEAFDNLNKGDTVVFDAGPFSDRFRSTAMNIRVIEDVPQGSEAIEQ